MFIRLCLLLACCAVLTAGATVCPNTANAQEVPPLLPEAAPPREVLVLIDGERLSGTSRGLADGHLRWQLPTGQEMLIPLSVVDHIDHLPTDLAALATGKPSAEPPAVKIDRVKIDPVKIDPAVEPAQLVVPPVVVPPVVPLLPITEAWYQAGRSTYASTAGLTAAWTKRFELGGNFTDGNSQTSEYLVGGLMERKYEKWSFQTDWNGRYGTARNRVTQNKVLINGTTDYKHDGNWIFFATQRHVFDQLADLDYRGTFAFGPGYKFYDDDDKRLIVRIGPGATVEKYDPPTGFRTTPDIFIETDSRWPIYERTQFENKNVLTPSIDDLSIFRLVSTYGLLVQLDESERWALKFGLRHEHNSLPNAGKKENDYTSSFSIVYTRDKKKKK